MQLRDQVFLVSGGGSGLGAACVRLLAEQGGRVMIADLNADAGQALAADLGPQSQFVRTDVADEVSAGEAVDRTVATFGALHGLINCAGIIAASRVLGKEGPHELELFARIIRVNLVGTFNMCRLAAAAMAANEPNQHGERGVIVNTSSIAAFDGQIGQAAYSASKGGVASLSLPMARELARFGIRVVAIAPGVFETPMVSGLPPAAQESLAAAAPFPPRLGKPVEYAELARHIIENPMLNGTVIRLDGAMRMTAK